MSNPLDSTADGAERWLADWSASASAQVAKAQQMSDQVSRVSLSASSPDGSVEVTVGPSGAVTDLRLGEALRKRPADEIAQEILRVMRRAQAKLAGRVAEIAADTVGADSAAGRAVVSSFEQRYAMDDDGSGEAGSASDWRGRAR